MTYSEELLIEIEMYASRMMHASEISFLLSVDERTLVDDINTVGHPARIAFFRGLTATAKKIRENIIDTAIAGSPYSIAECQRLIMAQLSEVTL